PPECAAVQIRRRDEDGGRHGAGHQFRHRARHRATVGVIEGDHRARTSRHGVRRALQRCRERDDIVRLTQSVQMRTEFILLNVQRPISHDGGPARHDVVIGEHHRVAGMAQLEHARHAREQEPALRRSLDEPSNHDCGGTVGRDARAGARGGCTPGGTRDRRTGGTYAAIAVMVARACSRSTLSSPTASPMRKYRYEKYSADTKNPLTMKPNMDPTSICPSAVSRLVISGPYR